MVRWNRVLLVKEHLLVQLLARPDASELNVDVLAWLEAAESDEIRGQVDDLDRLAHVQHEDLAAESECAGLKDELHRFRNRHEVAAHLGVRDRYGPPSTYLTEERRHDAPSASKHVSEAHRHEIAPVRHGCVLHHSLGEAFRCPHDTRWANRLVGRDEDEVLDPRVDRGVHDVGGAVDVVGDRLDDILFHERNVLVRRCVEYCVGATVVEDRVHALGITDVRDHGHDGDARVGRAELRLDVEDRVLAVAQDDEHGWLELGQLTAELASDGATGARDQDSAALAEVADSGEIGLDRLATEEVLDLDVAKGRRRGTAGENVRKWRESASLEPSVGCSLDYATREGAGG